MKHLKTITSILSGVNKFIMVMLSFIVLLLLIWVLAAAGHRLMNPINIYQMLPMVEVCNKV